jgi:hypothetical protein
MRELLEAKEVTLQSSLSKKGTHSPTHTMSQHMAQLYLLGDVTGQLVQGVVQPMDST